MLQDNYYPQELNIIPASPLCQDQETQGGLRHSPPWFQEQFWKVCQGATDWQVAEAPLSLCSLYKAVDNSGPFRTPAKYP